MDNYLLSYLDVLPEYQRRRIEDIMLKNQDLYNIANVTESEFEALIKRLAEDHVPLTTYTPQVDKLDPDIHNAFFSNADVDVNMLFLESLLIESASSNYERIFDGILSSLDKEVSALKNRVENLRMVSETENGAIIHKRSFESLLEMEDREAYANLFTDRDGTPVPNISFERKHDQYFAALAKTKEVDCLRDASGKTTATIRVADRRGLPVFAGNPSRYAVENAIDGSRESYWAEVVLTDEPITTGMNKGGI